ncbi:MAG: site-specific integrase [Planctomycetia bacterium]|nr:site-specific integrase [Planctomycetia bacterium]
MQNVPIYSTWQVDSWRLLSRTELATVRADLERKAKRSLNTRLNLVIVRLACCCGLRVSEIASLRLDDVRVADARPHIVIRAAVAKSRRLRRIPLWWDRRTLETLVEWKQLRVEEGATARDRFVVSAINRTRGKTLTRQAIRQRFRTACKVLGKSRLESLSIHDGRHTFVSHALAGGRTLAEIRDAAGHANIVTTSAYLHVVVREGTPAGQLFA